MNKRKRVAVVNKIFWPEGTLIGEALLEVTRQLSIDCDVVVIAQSGQDIKSKLSQLDEFKEVKFSTCKPLSKRTSSLVLRGVDAMYFMLYVLISLVYHRPDLIYISTNPPVLVPFMVSLYARIFGAKYLYHVQDIHPEAANIISQINKPLFNLIRYFDTVALEGAASIVTLTNQMSKNILLRGNICSPIHLVHNPANVGTGAVESDTGTSLIYCGSLGRFQNIALLADSIDSYLSRGGALSFLFCGEGVFAARIEALANKFDRVRYIGPVSPSEAADLVASHKWALLPIEDRVTEYAFPSKASTYLSFGCNIFGITRNGSVVSDWITINQVGVAVEPNISDVVSGLFALERIFPTSLKLNTEQFRHTYSMQNFGTKIANLIRSMGNQDSPIIGRGK